MLNFQKPLFNVTNPSGTLMSEVIDLTMYCGYSIHLIPSGLTSFSARIEVSNDIKDNATDTQNFVLLEGSNQSITAQYMYNQTWAHYKYVRLVLTTFVGAGTLDVYFNAKEI